MHLKSVTYQNQLMQVSAIIATYNRAGHISKAAASVLGQSLKDLELIVIDDGSTDSTRDVLQNFKDKRLKFFYQENKGVAAARNLGLKMARGRYVALLDSDDYWLEDNLMLQVRFMRDTGFMVSQTLEAWVRGHETVSQGVKHQKYAGWIFEKSLDMCLISPSCVMLDQDLVRQGYLFNEDLPACEDYDLWVRLTLRYPVGLLPRVLTVKQGGRGDQLSRKIIGMDLWRIYALSGLLQRKGVPRDKQAKVMDALEQKAKVYTAGCLKRGIEVEALRIKNLVASHKQKKADP